MNKWEREYAALDIQFDLINAENKRLEEENKMLKARIKYLENKCNYYEELIANHMSLEDVKYGEYDDK